MTAIKDNGEGVEEESMDEDRTIINLTDTRSRDNRRLWDHLLAWEHVDDPCPFTELDWWDVG